MAELIGNRSTTPSRSSSRAEVTPNRTAEPPQNPISLTGHGTCVQNGGMCGQLCLTKLSVAQSISDVVCSLGSPKIHESCCRTATSVAQCAPPATQPDPGKQGSPPTRSRTISMICQNESVRVGTVPLDGRQ